MRTLVRFDLTYARYFTQNHLVKLSGQTLVQNQSDFKME